MATLSKVKLTTADLATVQFSLPLHYYGICAYREFTNTGQFLLI
jgi:hypothetical protein